jgi:hypothetical protein
VVGDDGTHEVTVFFLGIFTGVVGYLNTQLIYRRLSDFSYSSSRSRLLREVIPGAHHPTSNDLTSLRSSFFFKQQLVDSLVRPEDSVDETALLTVLFRLVHLAHRVMGSWREKAIMNMTHKPPSQPH